MWLLKQKITALFPKPNNIILFPIDKLWSDICEGEYDSTRSYKLQHDLTAMIEAHIWMDLYNRCGKYQQSILTAIALKYSTSHWLTTIPLSTDNRLQ